MDDIIFVNILSWVIARDKMQRKWCCTCQNFMQSRKTSSLFLEADVSNWNECRNKIH